MIGADIADTARQHDRLMVAAQFAAVVAVDPLFIGAEIAVQRRTAKFVVKRRAAQRAFRHDVQRADDAIGLAKILFPRLLEAGNTQVGNGEAHQTGFWLRAAAGGALIADFAAGSGRRARPRRDRRWVVMGFHFHQDMGRFLMEIVNAALRVGIKATDLGAFHHRRVVFIGRQDIIRRLREGVFDHFEQGFRLSYAVDHPVRVEDFMAAVFGVRLSEHIKLDIVRVAPQFFKRGQQVINLVVGQRQAQFLVSLLQRRAPLRQDIHALQRLWLLLNEQLFRIGQIVIHGFHHAIVQQRGELRPLRFR